MDAGQGLRIQFVGAACICGLLALFVVLIVLRDVLRDAEEEEQPPPAKMQAQPQPPRQSDADIVGDSVSDFFEAYKQELAAARHAYILPRRPRRFPVSRPPRPRHFRRNAIKE